jgi:hypothetical protein
MCIKCEMKKVALRQAGLEVKHETVGTVSKELLGELKQYLAAKDKLEDQIDAAIIVELKDTDDKEQAAEKVFDQFREKWEGIQGLLELVFDDILEANDLTREEGEGLNVTMKGRLVRETVVDKETGRSLH